MRTRWFLVMTLLLFVGTLIGISSLGGPESAPQKERYIQEHPVSIPSNARVVQISSAMPMPSAHARRLSAMLEHGSMPRHATAGEVLSDTECTPGKDMISRCRNELRLADGSTVVLRHPHKMADIPCLAPGETVRLVPLDA